MAKTTAALLERALQIVDEVGGGQTPSAEDSDYAFSTLLALVEELNARGITYVAIDPTDRQALTIPEELFLMLSDRLALELRPAFKGGIITDAEREDKNNSIRRVTYIKPTSEPVKTEYF